MKRPGWIDQWFHGLVDALFARWPQPAPSPAALARCRLVSHRGEHDNETVFENTLAAFDRALAAGVWGMEFDLRWTRDLQPVVHHDADLARIFGSPVRICDLTLERLREDFPLVPTLAEVVRQYGKRIHLMMEIKAEPYPDPRVQNRRLADLFAPLTPGRDYHLLALAPEIFQPIAFTSPDTFLLIAETRPLAFGNIALERGFGGICGHYLLVTERLKKRHQDRGQGVGTGYPASKNALYREIHRGVDWIFSNRAAFLQRICRSGRR